MLTLSAAGPLSMSARVGTAGMGQSTNRPDAGLGASGGAAEQRPLVVRRSGERDDGAVGNPARGRGVAGTEVGRRKEGVERGPQRRGNDMHRLVEVRLLRPRSDDATTGL